MSFHQALFIVAVTIGTGCAEDATGQPTSTASPDSIKSPAELRYHWRQGDRLRLVEIEVETNSGLLRNTPVEFVTTIEATSTVEVSSVDKAGTARLLKTSRRWEMTADTRINGKSVDVARCSTGDVCKTENAAVQQFVERFRPRVGRKVLYVVNSQGEVLQLEHQHADDRRWYKSLPKQHRPNGKGLLPIFPAAPAREAAGWSETSTQELPGVEMSVHSEFKLVGRSEFNSCPIWKYGSTVTTTLTAAKRRPGSPGTRTIRSKGHVLFDASSFIPREQTTVSEPYNAVQPPPGWEKPMQSATQIRRWTPID